MTDDRNMSYKNTLDKVVDSRPPYCPECKGHCRECMSFYACKPIAHARTTELWLITDESIKLIGEYR